MKKRTQTHMKLFFLYFRCTLYNAECKEREDDEKSPLELLLSVCVRLHVQQDK